MNVRSYSQDLRINEVGNVLAVDNLRNGIVLPLLLGKQVQLWRGTID